MFAAAAAPLDAQELPWCVKLDVFTKNCAFAKYDECVAVAKNATSPATGVGSASATRTISRRPPRRSPPSRRRARPPEPAALTPPYSLSAA